MRKLILWASMVVAFCGPAAAQQSDLTVAVNWVVDFPKREKRDVVVDGRRFHIKVPVITYRTVNGVRLMDVAGQISHVLRARADDQYYYRHTIIVTEDRLISAAERINRGGFSSILNRAAVELRGSRAAGWLSSIEEAFRPPERNLGWLRTARRIAAAVSVRVADLH